MTQADVVGLASLLSQREGLKGGKPCIAGTGVTVHYVGTLYDEGLSPAAIRAELSNVPSLAGVHAAIAYYLANQERIRAEIRAEDTELRRAAAKSHAANLRSA